MFLPANSMPSYLALSCVGFISTSPALGAETIAAASVATGQLEPDIVVYGERIGEPGSPKATAPLLDTPQTITVVSDQTLRKQNLLTLRDALATIPGITFGAGEGGGGYGDSINLRGYAANNDLTQDGVRDSAQYSRTDPFNLQQIEVYNGANSVFNGSGSVGGTINLVAKAPQRDDLTIVQAGVGTDDYYRGTLDTNLRLTDAIALRGNAMLHSNALPGRDVETFHRWGIAPVITFGIDEPTRLTIGYVHQDDDNVPVYGVPYFNSLVNAGSLAGIDDSDYFGYRNLDEQQITVDRLTVTFNHDFTAEVSLQNLSRWQDVAQYSQTSAPQGTFCLATTNLQPVGADGAATVGLPCPAEIAPGFFLPSGPRGLVRDQDNELLHNQTDLRVVSGGPGAPRNTLVVGAAFTREDYDITTASLLRNADGSAVVPLPVISLSDPDTVYRGPLNKTVTAMATSWSRNVAGYVFDTLELTEKFELNAGLRYEQVHAEFRNIPLAAPPPGTLPLTPLQSALQVSDEDLFSYRAGAVFKPVPTLSLYAAYGNAKTPSSATVRLGCGVVTVPGGANPCATAPEEARNYEVGAKSDVFDRQMQLTLAVFRNERSNYRVASNDPSLPATLQVLDGQSRVDGVAFGATGAITEDWALFANYTYLDSQVVQGISNFCLANPGTTGCNNSAAVPDPQRGNELVQTPRHAGSLFTSYRLPIGLEVGYGFTYQGGFATNNSVLANPTQFRVDDYLVHRVFLSYAFNNGFTAQLNVQNLTDESYYTGVRNNVNATTGAITGGWATPGDVRSAVLNLFYSF